MTAGRRVMHGALATLGLALAAWGTSRPAHAIESPSVRVLDTFDDVARNVHISVDAIDAAGGSATISLGRLPGLSPHVPAVLHPFASRAVEVYDKD